MKNVKQRILTGWTFRRVLHFLLGTIIIAQSISIQLWLGILFGAYFASMGLFNFGCAAGNCYGGSCVTQPIKKAKHKFKI